MSIGPDRRQAAHYDRILGDYDRHYYDRYSLVYRERFILKPLLEGIDLRGKRVADLASGSGETSRYLLRSFPGVEPTGFDISSEACRRYREEVGRRAHVLDLTCGTYAGETFDAAIIIGGLHHCVADLAGTLGTIAKMLRPGGVLLMFEPNKDYMLEGVRRIWYRADRFFDDSTEAALSHDELLVKAGSLFEARLVRYLGGPAYFLVLNSLMFRLPPGLKALIAPPLLAAEGLYNRLASRWFCSAFVAQWVRRG
jgi:SAM-dependent methyltransferase